MKHINTSAFIKKCLAIFADFDENHVIEKCLSIFEEYYKIKQKHFSTAYLNKKPKPMPKKCSLTDHCNDIFTLIDNQTAKIVGHHKKLPLIRFM